MDWPRAKTILIVALLGLNAFLAYHVYADPVLRSLQPAYLAAASETQVARALQPLRWAGAQPSPRPARLPVLLLRPRPAPFDPLALLDGREARRQEQTFGSCSGRVYTAGARRLVVSDHCLIYHDSAAGNVGQGGRLDVLEANREAERFLARLGDIRDDVRGPIIRVEDVPGGPAGGTLTVLYRQQIAEAVSGHLTLFDGYLKVRMTRAGVATFQRRLWEVEESLSAARPVVPVTTLILSQTEPGGRLQPLLPEPDAPASDASRTDRTPEVTAELGYAVIGTAPAGAGSGAGEPGGQEPSLFVARPVWRVQVAERGTVRFDAITGEPLSGGGP